jgi:hypothetical protein
VIEIEADFSTTVRGGMIRAYRSDAPDSVEIGDVVRAVDPDEGLSYVGTIYEIDGPFIYLVMHWHNNRDVISVAGGMWLFPVTDTGATSGTGHSDENQTVRLPVAV